MRMPSSIRPGPAETGDADVIPGATRSPWREHGSQASRLDAFGPGIGCLVAASSVIGGAARNRRDTGLPASRVLDWLGQARQYGTKAPPGVEAELLEQVAMLHLLMGDTAQATTARRRAGERRTGTGAAAAGASPHQQPLYGPAMHVLLARHDRATALKVMVAATAPESRADSLEALSIWYSRNGDTEAAHHALHAAAAEAQQIESAAGRARRLAAMAHRAALSGDTESGRLIEHARSALDGIERDVEPYGTVATRIARAALLAGDEGPAADLLARRQQLADDAISTGPGQLGERDRSRWPGHLLDMVGIEHRLIDGHIDPAIEQAKRIRSAQRREQVAYQIIEHLVERGQCEAALRAAGSLALGSGQAVALFAIADRQLRAGQLQAAHRTLRGIAWQPGEFYLAGTLVSFQYDAADIAGARETIRRLHGAAMRQVDPAHAIEALAHVAVSRALLGERAEAGPVIERIIKLLESLPRPSAVPALYTHTAAAAVWAAGETEAARWADRVRDPVLRAFTCAGMAEGLLGTHRSVGAG